MSSDETVSGIAWSNPSNTHGMSFEQIGSRRCGTIPDHFSSTGGAVSQDGRGVIGLMARGRWPVEPVPLGQPVIRAVIHPAGTARGARCENPTVPCSLG